MAILLQVLVTLPHQSQMIIVGSWWSWGLTDCIMKLLMKSFAVRGIVVVTYVHCTMVQLGWKYTRIFKELSVLLVPYECMPSPCTFSTLFLCLIESVTVQQKMWAFPFDIWVFLQSGLRGLSFPFQKGQEHCAHMTFKQRCKPITSSFLEDFVLIIVLEFVATMQSCCRSTWRKWGGTWQVPAFSSGLYSGIL